MVGHLMLGTIDTRETKFHHIFIGAGQSTAHGTLRGRGTEGPCETSTRSLAPYIILFFCKT